MAAAAPDPWLRAGALVDVKWPDGEWYAARVVAVRWSGDHDDAGAAEQPAEVDVEFTEDGDSATVPSFRLRPAAQQPSELSSLGGGDGSTVAETTAVPEEELLGFQVGVLFPVPKRRRRAGGGGGTYPLARLP